MQEYERSAVPATDDAPDVVNGSFGFPELAGSCFPEFEPDIAVLRAFMRVLNAPPRVK